MRAALYECGDVLKERITGFTGEVMVVDFYFSGCIHYGLLCTKLDKTTGKHLSWQYFDESRLQRVKKGKRAKGKPTSGAFPNSPQIG